MLPEPDKPSTPEVRPSPRSTSSERLLELFEAQRRASAQLHAELRNRLKEWEDLFPTPARPEHRRLKAQFEKAFELTKQAEAKIELLISHYSGRI
jgi:hypothetical protein